MQLKLQISRQFTDAKIREQKGNSPDYKLRPLKIILVKGSFYRKQLGGGIGSSHPLKKA